MNKEIGLIDAIKTGKDELYSIYLHEVDGKSLISVCKQENGYDLRKDSPLEIIDSYELDMEEGKITRKMSQSEIEGFKFSKRSQKQEIYPHINGKPCQRKAYEDKALYTKFGIGRQRFLLREDEKQELPFSMYKLEKGGKTDLILAATVGESGNIMIWDKSDLKMTKEGKVILEDLEKSAELEYKDTVNREWISIDEYSHYDESINKIVNRNNEDINGKKRTKMEELKCPEAKGNISIPQNSQKTTEKNVEMEFGDGE